MIYDTIRADIVSAMKAKDSTLLQTLRTLDSEVQKKGIDAGATKADSPPEKTLVRDGMILSDVTPGRMVYPDELVAGVLQKGIKQRLDSIEAFEEGRRPDLVAAETAQLEVYRKYLPKQMSEEEIKAVVAKAFAEGAGNVGAMMKAVMPLLKGKADGKLINKIVQEALK